MTGKNLKPFSAVWALAADATVVMHHSIAKPRGAAARDRASRRLAASGKGTTNAEGRNFEDDQARVFFQVPMAQVPMACESFHLSYGGLD